MTIGIVALNLGMDISYRVENFVVGGVFRAGAVASFPGGKGVNVARVLLQLGETPHLFGCIGGRVGAQVAEGLYWEKLALLPVRIRGESRTCIHVVDPKRAVQTVINDPGPRLSVTDNRRLRAAFRVFRRRCAVLIITGSLPRGVPPGVYAAMCREAAEEGIPTVVDAGGEALRRAFHARPLLVKPNREEFAALAGRRVSARELQSVLRRLSCSTETIIAVTLGAAGVIAGHRGSLIAVRPPRVPVVNAIGSGDAFVAGFMSHYLRTQDVGESLRRGVVCGTLNAMTERPGTMAYGMFCDILAATRIRRTD